MKITYSGPAKDVVDPGPTPFELAMIKKRAEKDVSREARMRIIAPSTRAQRPRPNEGAGRRRRAARRLVEAAVAQEAPSPLETGV